MVAVERHDRVSERARTFEGGDEGRQGGVEIVHRVDVVAERRVLERADVEHLVAVGEEVERVVEAERDEEREVRPALGGEHAFHALEEHPVGETPADRLPGPQRPPEHHALEPVARVEHAAVPEPALERVRRKRRVPLPAQRRGERDEVVVREAERERAAVERVLRVEHAELAVGAAPLPGLVEDEREVEGAALQGVEERCDLRAADAGADHPLLQRLHLDQHAGRRPWRRRRRAKDPSGRPPGRRRTPARRPPPAASACRGSPTRGTCARRRTGGR